MNIGQALHSLRPGSEWVVRGTDIEWLDKVQAQPSQSEIDEEIVRLQAEHDSQEYARNRQAEYPEIGDQLDMLWHAIDTGDWTDAKVKTTEFYTALKAVKDANPK
jgi:hypothetical protein